MRNQVGNETVIADGEVKWVTRPDVIKLFPAAAYSVWQDALYAPGQHPAHSNSVAELVYHDSSIL
jgi:hypothetical protein